MKIKFLALFVLLYACNNTADKDKTAGQDSTAMKKDSPVAMADKNTGPPDTAGKKRSLFDSQKGYLLALKTDSFEQKMKVVKRKRTDVMDFSLILTNRIKHVSDTVSGVLTYVDSGGDETDASDDGYGFSYDNWKYTNKNGCQLNFRITDDDSVKYIRIQDFDCAKKLKTSSPFETKRVLKRVDIP